MNAVQREFWVAIGRKKCSQVLFCLLTNRNDNFLGSNCKALDLSVAYRL